MRKVIVSDASPLIALAKLDCLELLFCSFSEVHIPRAVYLEVTAQNMRVDSQRIITFLNAHEGDSCFLHEDLKINKYLMFKEVLDEGESQALTLATELECGVLIDERLGRKIAAQYSIPYVGVLGVLLKAKEVGQVDKLKPLIDDLIKNKYRVSDKVIKIILGRAGES